MSVYLDYRLPESENTIKTHVSWHNLHLLLAVASYDQDRGGMVTIYGEEEVLIALAGPYSLNGSQVTTLAWNPLRKLLVISWDSGDISLWTDSYEELIELPSSHKQTISLLCWNSSGTRIVSIDAEGTCIGWRLDAMDQLTSFYHHELKDSLTDIVFRQEQRQASIEITKLAKAAVMGDEHALNAFCDWPASRFQKPETFTFSSKEVNDFYLSSSSGVIFYVNETGSCGDVAQIDGSIRKLLHNSHLDMLIAISELYSLVIFRINKEGTLKEHSRFKLSGCTPDIKVIWAGPLTLAISTGENLVRMWNIESGHNFVLSLEDYNALQPSEVLTSLAFEENKKLLAVSTTHGQIIAWKNVPSSEKLEDECWKPQLLTSLYGAIKAMTWGSSKGILAIMTTTNVFILREQEQAFHLRDNLALVQLSAHNLHVELLSYNSNFVLTTEAQIKKIGGCSNNVAILSDKKIFVYEIGNNDAAKLVGSFDTTAKEFLVYEQSLYLLEGDKIEVKTFQGTLKQTLTFTEEEGRPHCIDIRSSYLVCATDSGYIKIWNLSRREARPHVAPRCLIDKNEFRLRSVKTNCKGNKVSFFADKVNGKKCSSDFKVHVWDIEHDSVSFFDFSERDLHDVAENTTKNPLHTEPPNHLFGKMPISHHWDPEDVKLLVCETGFPFFGEDIPTVNVPNLLVSLYVTNDHGILVKDVISVPPTNKLLGICIPFYYLWPLSPTFNVTQPAIPKILSKFNANSKYEPFSISKDKICVIKRPMKEFEGLDECDKMTRDAIMNFSFHLTCGNMDEAFKSIRVIKNEAIWKNLAQMCVKTRRLDVALVCLGKMGNARGSRALRMLPPSEDLTAKVALLALNLGMVSEAEELYKSSERFDLLNQLYQDMGQWDKAIEIAQNHDRIHLRNTYYNYAQSLEAKEDIWEAIKMYEKSGTHHFEVPRMLFEDPQSLEAYIVKNKDKNLYKWWAHYLESISEMETALHFYELAQDYFSLVRVYCYCHNLEKASEIANESGDRAACFHLGRHFENLERPQEAIHFFTRAHAYSNAMRICKENGLEDQLMNLALLGTSREMVDAARHYQDKEGYQDRAIMLYHKAGHLNKAIELAFKLKDYNSLQLISNDLDYQTDPDVLKKCSHFFLEHGHYEKAVDLLALSKNFEEALEICMKHNVIITEDLANKLSVEKDATDPESRIKILEMIGECCLIQGNYHLSAKKFTQAGNKIQAMKALLKSGDTERIIFFANVSRQKEIYIMAANYLQSADWRHDPEIMKNIINFYVKGKAPSLLAGFYDACAQIEIDEYQNYEKALKAVNEAVKCYAKCDILSNPQLQSKVDQMNKKLKQLRTFVDIQQGYADDPDAAVQQCQELLRDPDLELAVRRGDVYGFLVEHFVKVRDYHMAHAIIKEMLTNIPGVNLPYFIDAQVLRAISNALNISLLGDFQGDKQTPSESSDHEIEEEL